MLLYSVLALLGARCNRKLQGIDSPTNLKASMRSILKRDYRLKETIERTSEVQNPFAKP